MPSIAAFDSFEAFRRLCASLSARKALAILAVFALAVLLGGAVGIELAGGDETRVAGIAREMSLRSEWLLPRLNGRPFLEYPPLYYLLDAVAFNWFGVSDFAAKLPSVLAAVAGALALFNWGRALGFSPAAALFSGVALITSAQYFSNALVCRVDMLLAAFFIIGWWGFTEAVVTSRSPRRGGLLLALGISGAVLTKNLAGAVIVLCGMGVWLVVESVQSRRVVWRHWFAAGFAGFAALGVYALYAFGLWLECGWPTVSELVVRNNFGRFTGDFAEHVEPFYYYLLKLPEQFQPFLVVLILALIVEGRRMWKTGVNRTALLLGVALLTPFVLLSSASGKRQVYLLPLAAPAALWCGLLWDRLMAGECGNISGLWCARLKSAASWTAAAVGTIGAVMAVVLALLPSGSGMIAGWSALPLAAAGWGAWLWLRRGRTGAALLLMLALWGLIWGGPVAGAVAFQSRRESFRPAFEAAGAYGNRVLLDCPPERIAGAAVYYLGRRVPEIVMEHIDFQSGDALIVTCDRGRVYFPSGAWDCKGFGRKYILALRR